jgi:PAS domain S-box-containing protein
MCTVLDRISHLPLSSVIDVLDALHCGAALLNRSGWVVHANPRLCEMMGRPRQEIVGREVASFYSDEADIAKVRESYVDFDRPAETEFHLTRPDASRTPVIIASRPLPIPLDDLRVLTIIDISQQKSAETQLQHNYEFVVQMSNTVLEQAMDLKDYSKVLEAKVQQRTRELHDANLDAIYTLAVACEVRDMDTGEHVRRIEHYTRMISLELKLPEKEADRIAYSSVLHDVGKLHIPDRILHKPGPLTEEERAELEQHTLIGERILPARPFYELSRQIARSHHENFDGSGYPDGLKDGAIPLAARITHVADVFDALSSARVYKPAWKLSDAVNEIHAGTGSAFDPEMVAAFDRVMEKGLLQPYCVLE